MEYFVSCEEMTPILLRIHSNFALKMGFEIFEYFGVKYIFQVNYSSHFKLQTKKLPKTAWQKAKKKLLLKNFCKCAIWPFKIALEC